MLEQAKMHITEVLGSGLLGAKEDCKYYPCHFKDQDCTWCFCPFYPCLDDNTGGKYVKSEKTEKDVWSCADCNWMHEKYVSVKVLERLKNLPDWTDLDSCKKIRLELLGD